MIRRSPRGRWLAGTGALIGWFGILLQLRLSLDLAAESGRGPARGLIDFLSYFTVLTNLLVATALTAQLAASARTGNRLLRFFRRPGTLTGLTAAIALVGLGYFFLLRTTWDPEGWQLVADVVLHYLMPVLFTAWWWRFVPKHALEWRQTLGWAIYPVAYFAYTLVRGELTGRYPYPFIDAAALGYGRALLSAVLLLVVFMALSAGLVGVARATRRAGSEPGEPSRPPV